MQQNPTELLEFPCTFPLKIMGAKHPEFPSKILEVVQQYAPHTKMEDMILRDSSSGNYQGITLPVHVQSKEQLDKIYLTLTSHPMVKVVF